MLAASLKRISIGLLLKREYNIFLLGKLARLVMGTIFLVIGERAKRARHSQVCSIENRGYIIYIYIYYGTCKFCSYNP